MTRRISLVPGRFFGRGEQTAAAPGLYVPGQGSRIRNAILSGPGVLIQSPDFLLADTCKNSAVAENHVVCGIFPFQTQGGASAASAAIWISLDAVNNVLRLHQVGENHTILRSLDVPGAYTPTVPPQVTGVEMFGKFYFVDYGDVLAANRLGMCVFDPAGAGSVTRPTYDLVAGGVGAAALRFRGITKHRGASLIGWGYDEESNPEGGHVLRTAKYGLPDTWVPDTSEISAFRVPIGTVNVPIIGCATSGRYTIIGKETEIFKLDGDYSSQFYSDQIGEAFGPVSTAGMCSAAEHAVWMSAQGPARSTDGGPVELMGLDQIVRTMLNTLDLAKVCATHDVDNHRVVFTIRRRFDDNGAPVNESWPTEILYWDHFRDQFYRGDIPNRIFCCGTSKGPGVNLPGPTGVVSGIGATAITQCSAKIAWTAGDPAPDVQFEVEYKTTGSATWLTGGTTGTQVTNLTLQNLTAGIQYDVRVRQIRNSQFSAFTTAAALFTTTAASVVPVPAGVDSVQSTWDPPTHAQAELTFQPVSACGLFEADIIVGRGDQGVTSGTNPNNSQVERNQFSLVGTVSTSAGYFLDPTSYFISPVSGLGPTLFYWVRFRSIPLGTASVWVAANQVAGGGLQLLAGS